MDKIHETRNDVHHLQSKLKGENRRRRRKKCAMHVAIYKAVEIIKIDD